MKKLVFGVVLLCAAVAGAQSIYVPGTNAVSCNAATAAGACAYITSPLFGGYTVPSSFSWQTITTGSPTGVSVNFEGSMDGRTSLDGVATASSTTFTSASLKFTSADAGKSIYIGGGGSVGATFTTTIASVTNGTTVVLTAAPTASIVGAPVFVGTFQLLDNSTATAGEMRSVVNKTVRWIRCNVVTLSGGASPTATCSIMVKGS